MKMCMGWRHDKWFQRGKDKEKKIGFVVWLDTQINFNHSLTKPLHLTFSPYYCTIIKIIIFSTFHFTSQKLFVYSLSGFKHFQKEKANALRFETFFNKHNLKFEKLFWHIFGIRSHIYFISDSNEHFANKTFVILFSWRQVAFYKYILSFEEREKNETKQKMYKTVRKM
jgi:hypothetical protein